MKSDYLTFKKAKKFARSLGLNSSTEWSAYRSGQMHAFNLSCKLPRIPKEIPRSPSRTYKGEGWDGWKDWLDIKSKYRSYKDARKFARSLGLIKRQDWDSRYTGSPQKKKTIPELPTDIPRQPKKYYEKRGCWVSWPDWLGSEDKIGQSRLRVGKIQYRSFEKARKFARSLGLKDHGEWRRYCRGKMPEKEEKPKDIHSRPATFYGYKGWKGFEDWLGTNSKRKK